MNGEKSMYQMYNSQEEMNKATLSYTGVLLPNPILKSATVATNTAKVANSTEAVIVGTGSVLRKVDFFQGFTHALNKHLIGDGATSLKVLDAGGTLEKWGNYVTLLSQTGSGTSKLVQGGEVLEIMGQMEKTGGGILNVGVRLFKAIGNDIWRLTTILTRQ